MKKIIICLMACMCLVGCSSTETNSYMVNKTSNKYILVDSSGDALNKSTYDKFKLVNDTAYLVTTKKVTSLVDLEGKVLIKGNKTTSLKVLANMIIATDKDKKITIYDLEGKKLFTENKNTSIKFNELPIVYNKKTKKYSILNTNGEVVKKVKEKDVYTSYNGNYIAVAYKKSVDVYSVTSDKLVDTLKLGGEYSLKSYKPTKGYLFLNESEGKYAYANKNGKVVDERKLSVDKIKFNDNCILATNTKENKKYLISTKKKEPIEVNSYYQNYENYTKKSEFVYTHKFVFNGKEKEVNDVQLNPEIVYTAKGLFPVFKKSKGYQFYDYRGKQEFKGTFDSAEPFDENNRSIVSKDDKYYLINTNGKKISKEYKEIKYLSNGYYAAFDSASKYVLIGTNGKKVLDESFMGDGQVFKVDTTIYALLNKAGTTYLYNLTDDKEIKTIQGEYKYNSKLKYIVKKDKKVYYDLDGELIYKRG
ncbi:MAG: hypothetical protein PHH04_04730 [Thomasclavelia sp.]|nr:hypothetical protein [Thomasclavelia sp.]